MIKKPLLKKPLNKRKLKQNRDTYVDPKKLLTHLDLHKFVLSCLIYLDLHKVEPRIQETIKIMDKWNKTSNYRFVRHRVNTDSGVFKMILSLVSYRMHIHKISLNTFFEAIKKFDLISGSNGLLLYKKKLKLIDNFLWGISKYNEKSWFEICIQDEQSAMADTCGIKINFKNTFEKIKKAFIRNFYESDSDLGREVIFQNSTSFILFSEKLVEHHKNRVMCSYRTDFNQLIDDYFEFAREVTKNSKWNLSTRISYILSQKLLLDFAANLRNEPGMDNFFSDKKR